MVNTKQNRLWLSVDSSEIQLQTVLQDGGMKEDQEKCQCLLERVQSVKMAGNQNKGETTYFPSNPSLFQVTNTIQEQEHKKNRNTTLKSSFIPLRLTRSLLSNMKEPT